MTRLLRQQGVVDVGVVNCNWKIVLDAFQEVYHRHRRRGTG